MLIACGDAQFRKTLLFPINCVGLVYQTSKTRRPPPAGRPLAAGQRPPEAGLGPMGPMRPMGPHGLMGHVF